MGFAPIVIECVLDYFRRSSEPGVRFITVNQNQTRIARNFDQRLSVTPAKFPSGQSILEHVFFLKSTPPHPPIRKIQYSFFLEVTEYKFGIQQLQRFISQFFTLSYTLFGRSAPGFRVEFIGILDLVH